MLARSDIVDIFLKVINGGEKASRRIFISDWELRRLHKPAEKSIHIPRSAIISPLSRDWLEYEGIEVIFDETGK